jgi:hypothetical protein
MIFHQIDLLNFRIMLNIGSRIGQCSVQKKVETKVSTFLF